MHRISELIIKHLQNNLSDAENEELLQWVNQSPENLELFSEITNRNSLALDLTRVEESQERLLRRLRASIPELNRVSVRKINWRLPAAAAVLILVAVYSIISRPGFKSDTGKSVGSSQRVNNDVPAPTGSKTILTLADGSNIVLDSVQDGTLAREGNVNVSKLNKSQLIYNSSTNGIASQKPTKILYNTLTTARGGQTMIILADGSKVWLNAESSIRFPTSFPGTERKVEISGEAYLEIAHNKSPFIVQVQDASVKVLGTHFNVMGYENERVLKTTLLKGSVLVSVGNQNSLLLPGQQAQLVPGTQEQIQVNNDIDTAQVVAWKNGEFQFDIADIGTVMRQLERWYDVEVAYAGDKPGIRFSGSINRNVSLSSVIKLLEFNGAHLKLEGRKVTVSK